MSTRDSLYTGKVGGWVVGWSVHREGVWLALGQTVRGEGVFLDNSIVHILGA